MNRRETIKLGLASILGVSSFSNASGLDLVSKKKLDEKQYDIIISGGGPAGIGAAFMSASLGMKTLIIEKNGCLGGVWTAGLLCYVMDQANKRGSNRRIIKELNRIGGSVVPESWSYVYNPEDMKYVLESLCAEFNIEIRYHSKVFDVDVSNQYLDSLYVASNSGVEKFTAKAYIDATGNGDLGACCGAGFDIGHPETGLMQPMTLMAMLTGFDNEIISKFINNPGVKGKFKFASFLAEYNIHPSYAHPTLWKINDTMYALMANHEYGVSSINAEDVTKATVNARKEIYEMIKQMNRIDGFQNVQIVNTAEQIGIREGRRLKGKYTVTKEDLIKGQKHIDNVCSVTFGIDVHSLDPSKGKTVDPVNEIKTKPYNIPARSLISKDFKNLLMAGRCISGDFFAHSSYRVTGNSIALGEGAAFTADILIKNNYTLEEKHYNLFENLDKKRVEIEG